MDSLGFAVCEAGEVGSHSKSYHFSPFPLVPFTFPPVPVVIWDGFIHFPSFRISPDPISYTLTSLYFILASPNLFQSIEHGRFSGKVYHIDRVISYRSGDMGRGLVVGWSTT